ncbi:MAG: helix-turn-helix domain-containing protein [Myxococcales bacterium]|nr:helix-turn-helix domain-containing protein [Myxococcales bacterium]
MAAARPTYLTALDLSQRFGRSERTIRRWLRAGLVPSFRIGGARLVAEDDLAAVCERLRADGRHGVAAERALRAGCVTTTKPKEIR